MATTGNVGNVLNPPTNSGTTSGNWWSGIYKPPDQRAKTYEDEAAQRLKDYQNTAPPPPPPGKKITDGRWVGNQWIDWDVMPDYPDYPYGPVQVKPPTTPGPPDETKPTPTTTPDTSSGGGSGGGGGGGTPGGGISDVYGTIIQKLLGMNAPGQAGSSYTAPVRHTSDPITYTPSEYDALVKAQISKMLSGPTAEEAGKAAANSEPVSAYRNSILRDLAVKRAGAAEAAGVSGTDRSGGFEGQQQALKQAAGESTAQFTGQYVDKAMADRRAELQQALEMAQKQGNFEDAQRLSAELARLQHDEEMYRDDLSLYNTNVNAELTRQQLANQAYATEVQKLLGLSDVEMRKFLAELQAGLGWATLGENSRQFDINKIFEGGA